MVPAQAPLPTPRNFPFQPCGSIQTSILISESFVGVSVAATRQNCARSAAGGGTRPCGANWPAPTTTAIVIVTFGSASDRRLSQVAAEAGDANTSPVTTI